MKYFTIKELWKSETARKNGIDNSPNEEVKKNQYGQYLMDVLNGKYID